MKTGSLTVKTYKWTFKARFRRHAFGWRSKPAIQRVKEAVSEIKKVARENPVLGAEGAVSFLERVSPALEQVDSSSGAIGTAVNNAIVALVPVIAKAPAELKTRSEWLERLWEAHAADDIPYIEPLADYWGELCGSKEVASDWGDQLITLTRHALSPDKALRGHFHGTSACLSALYRAERYDEIVTLLDVVAIWSYKRWAVKALAALGRKAEAIQYAEACRSPWASDLDIDGLSEELLLSSGLVDEAYERYGLRASKCCTYLATFRAVTSKYPHKRAADILDDLVKTTPGEEGKWFAAAKDAGLDEEALQLASRTPCDPRTLARAARDAGDEQPAFAIDTGLLALHWLVRGYGYEITSTDVWAAYDATMKAAGKLGVVEATRERARKIINASEALGGSFVKNILGRALDFNPANEMKRKKQSLAEDPSADDMSDPAWLHDDARTVRLPYSEEELDDLVEGFIVGNGDSAAWIELVQRYGFEAAKEILRNGFIRNDPNLDDELIH
jgi:NAD(P)-dependent dehydrogenase (short-subunit alcohol dehydrogenase family)